MTRDFVPGRRTTPRAALVLILVLLAVRPVAAGIADSALPEILPGAKSVHLYSVPGVTRSFGMGTFFSCTSADTAAIQVGVEVFGAGGLAANDPVATSLSVPPGATVLFATGPAAAFLPNSDLGVGLLLQGSARIVATSKKLVCTAFVADAVGTPPASGWPLTIVAKTKQKAAN
jgi:hypothetical protein